MRVGGAQHAVQHNKSHIASVSCQVWLDPGSENARGGSGQAEQNLLTARQGLLGGWRWMWVVQVVLAGVIILGGLPEPSQPGLVGWPLRPQSLQGQRQEPVHLERHERAQRLQWP